MKVIYMGKNKPSVNSGLRYLVDKGIHVEAVVAPPYDEDSCPSQQLICVAEKLNIPTATDGEIYDVLANKKELNLKYGYDLDQIDLVISFLFWKKIRKSLINLPTIACINFHPAPLPEFRGVCGYSYAIYEGLNYWGVSAHYVSEEIDKGDIIITKKFEIDPTLETAFSLEQRTQPILLDLFKDVIDTVGSGNELPRTAQGEGRYISIADCDKFKIIKENNTRDEIERKIRAFWYPPYGGAAIDIMGVNYTIVNDKILNDLGIIYRKISNKNFNS